MTLALQELLSISIKVILGKNCRRGRIVTTSNALMVEEFSGIEVSSEEEEPASNLHEVNLRDHCSLNQLSY